MSDPLFIGQWQGFYRYGAEYGELVENQEAEFRLFIEEWKDGQFSGRVIDWEGFGADGQVSQVQGFINDDFISFTKQYPKNYIIDEWGNEFIQEGVPGHSVVYEGIYNFEDKSFAGSWEIVISTEHIGELMVEELNTGIWRMKRGD